MQLAIVIPTYNERENIGRLVQYVLGLPYSPYVIVVDDNSPDGTADIVSQIAQSTPRLLLVRRPSKGGRGSASIEGFRHAQRLGADLIVEMDADFSHDPADITRLVERASQGYDLIIGSRYAQGSRIVNWPLSRRIFSRLANRFARLVLRVPISDYTNGYRCYSTRALQSIDYAALRCTGYAVLSELAYQLARQKMRITEIPVVFVDRRLGTSKTSLREVVAAFSTVIQLRMRYRRWKAPNFAQS
ncbi:MAG: polyprenol monophosphomannose synthase [Chloroflexi bacterium]|nr:polyprenol monophosphomannose synthase [Chloroflexota bacterium]